MKDGILIFYHKHTMKNLLIGTIQHNPIVGDVAYNTETVLALYKKAVARGAELVVAPELALIGYPAFDLLLRSDILQAQEEGIARLVAECTVPLVLGVVLKNKGEGKPLINVAILVRNGTYEVVSVKANLPFFAEFNEPRYFEVGDEIPVVFSVQGVLCAVLVCEDVWARANEQAQGRPLYARNQIAELKGKRVELLLSLNGSPYFLGKGAVRERVMQDVVAHLEVDAVAYVNRVGGQDELLFDGGSFVMDGAGAYLAPPSRFREEVCVVSVGNEDAKTHLAQEETIADLYEALVLSVRDYARKNKFKSALLGLSGGIDSALTLAVAVDALGAEQVHAVMMPFRYTAPESITDAREEAEALGVHFSVRPIEPMYTAFLNTLAEDFAHTKTDVTEENLQARIRGMLLMARSNKEGHLVLTTGNKSEMAVGYATLYGDMAGGFAVLKDVFKMQVYALAEYRNTLGQCIPLRVIRREPSAELAPEQKDRDSLPPYNTLDAILALYVEEMFSREAIVTKGFDVSVVEKVVRMVDKAEYKRRQAPPGPKVSKRALSPDGGRLMPISSGA